LIKHLDEDSQNSNQEEDTNTVSDQQKSLLKQFGVHVGLFEQAIKNFGETNVELKRQLANMVQRLLVDVEQVNDQL